MEDIKMERLDYKDLGYKSDEEMYFMLWLNEAKEAGFINSWFYEAHVWNLSFKKKFMEERKLKTKYKYIERHLLGPHVYSCDFTIYWNRKAEELFYHDVEGKYTNPLVPFHANRVNSCDDVSFVEVKPEFDSKNMTRLFN
jgi:hypothetical protein